MPQIHVVTHKEELRPHELDGKIAVVLDVLFATSTIVQALHAGAVAVLPTLNPDRALAAAAALPKNSTLLAGELNSERLPGFAHFAPLALAEESLAGMIVVYSTTNGTVALGAALSAESVYAGALLNAPRMAEHLFQHHREQDLVMVCAGSAGRFNLEDFYGAGHQIDTLVAQHPHAWHLSDTAIAARAVQAAIAPQACLRESRVGRKMAALGLQHEVQYAARSGVIDLVARLRDGRIEALKE
jgi:2-phosphosulfolactate phosphatase